MRLPEELLKIIQLFKKLPGVGSKSAERFAFNLLTWSESELLVFAEKIQKIPTTIKNCEECGCIQNRQGCPFCHNSARETKTLCIVANPKDIFSIEQTHSYKGLYHVLKNLLSPMEGKTLQDSEMEKIKKRIFERNIEEILIALDSTLEGDATSLFLKEHLKTPSIKISRLAFGVPIGSSLEYIDEGTLARALIGRQVF